MAGKRTKVYGRFTALYSLDKPASKPPGFYLPAKENSK